jgi:hypothetical protein
LPGFCCLKTHFSKGRNSWIKSGEITIEEWRKGNNSFKRFPFTTFKKDQMKEIVFILSLFIVYRAYGQKKNTSLITPNSSEAEVIDN